MLEYAKGDIFITSIKNKTSIKQMYQMFTNLIETISYMRGGLVSSRGDFLWVFVKLTSSW
jgi:hypothetical protein